VHHHCIITAPSLHHHCAIIIPSLDHHCTITAPSLHHVLPAVISLIFGVYLDERIFGGLLPAMVFIVLFAALGESPYLWRVMLVAFLIFLLSSMLRIYRMIKELIY